MTLRQRNKITELQAALARAKVEKARLRRKNDRLIAEVSRAYFALLPATMKLEAVRDAALKGNSK